MELVWRNWTVWALEPEARRIKRRAFMAGWLVLLAGAVVVGGALYA